MSRTWQEWVRHHAMLFALLTKQEEQMLGEWTVDLALEGWTADECWAASDWLARNNPPRARAQHLKALLDRLPVVRRERSREEAPPPEDERGTCVDCLGIGLVSVPNPKPDPLGRSIWYTMIVACHCPLGRWKQAHSFGEKGILDLSEYEATNPFWKQQMADHDRLLRRYPQRTRFARSLDETLGAIRSRYEAMQKQET